MGDGTSCTRTVNHPADGLTTIQGAVDAAGCGGTVLVAAGTYDERVFLSCGERLIGAGTGQTILDDTGLDALQGGLVNLGGVPFQSFPFTEGYELAHMTLRAGVEQPSLVGAAVGWTRNIRLHDLEIQGFTVGIGIATSTGSTMAVPIEATPVLAGKDAKRLQGELANMCPPEEARARMARAKKSLAELTRAKFAKRRSSP